MNKIQKTLTSTAVIGTALVGGAFGSSYVMSPANAADATTSTTAVVSTDTGQAPPQGQPPQGQPPGRDPSLGGHVGTNGTKEALLTGDTADKVKAAALAAVPGGTIQRVENDAEGATYEAHMTKADGSQVTVKLNASFNVTSTESGMR